MNRKCRAKHHNRLAGALALSAGLLPLWVVADDGNLTQQLRIQQQTSRFQLMLEQVQESARRRAALGHTAPATRAGVPASMDIGDWNESIRLDPVSVTDPHAAPIEPRGASQFQAQQAYERDQRRILDHRQQRRALIGGARSTSVIGVDSFAAKRNRLVRYKAQNKRQSLQRKLRR